MILRPYQRHAINATHDAFRRVRSVLLVLPTGAGKTVIAAEIIRRALAAGRSVLFVVHRVELVRQASERFADIPHGIIKAGYDEDRSKPTQIGSVQTLARREKPPADLLILDEAHHATAESWFNLVDHYADSWILGLTATPYRLDGRGLGRVFDELVVGCTTRELCEQGVLVEPTVYSHPTISFSGIRIVGGDYDLSELGDRMSKLVGNVIEHWHKLANGVQTVAFAVNVQHSREIAARFVASGVVAEHVDGETPADEREDILRRFALGQTRLISNCGILGEGWDLPALECAILARPTKSLALHRQQIGRIMRCCDSKEGALVLDHAGNTLEHGLVTMEPVYSLDDVVKVPKLAGVKRCPACYVVVPLTATVCPECGHVFDKPVVKPPDEDDGELVRYTMGDKRETYVALVATANARGYKLSWARIRYRTQFGVWPRFSDVEATYVCTGHEWEEKVYGGWKHVTRCCRCLKTERREQASPRDPVRHRS